MMNSKKKTVIVRLKLCIKMSFVMDMNKKNVLVIYNCACTAE